jgi:hypothetical protein
MFANGLMPKPVFETWFKLLPTRPLYSSNFISIGVFDKVVQGRKVPGWR